MATGKAFRGGIMSASLECRCSILNAREERLLDDESRVQVRLVCNRCGTILDSETHSSAPVHDHVHQRSEQEAAEGAN